MQIDLLPAVPDVVFQADGHRYWAWAYRLSRWVQVRSVSGIKKLGGISGFNRDGWRASLTRQGYSRDEAEQMMTEHTEKRAGIGTALHGAIESFVTGQPVQAVGEAAQMFDAWGQDFCPRIRRVLLLEQPMVHRFWFYAGMPDMVAELDDGQLWLLDWKSKPSLVKCRPSPDWCHQLAAYAELIWKQHRVQVDRVANVIVAPDGLVFHPWSRPEVAHCGMEFMGGLVRHHQQMAERGCVLHAAAYKRAAAFAAAA